MLFLRSVCHRFLIRRRRGRGQERLHRRSKNYKLPLTPDYDNAVLRCEKLQEARLKAGKFILKHARQAGPGKEHIIVIIVVAAKETRASSDEIASWRVCATAEHAVFSSCAMHHTRYTIHDTRCTTHFVYTIDNTRNTIRDDDNALRGPLALRPPARKRGRG